MDHFQGFFYGPCEHGFVADLDDRPLDDRRICAHRLYHLGVRRFGGNASVFNACLALSQDVEWPQARLLDQFPQLFFRKSLVEIIDFVIINAVFPKQRSQIAARRSGRFFVDGDLFIHVHQISPVFE